MTQETKLQDGLYRAEKGHLERIEVDNFGLRKLLVSHEAFRAVVNVQKSFRKALKGHKPDIGIVAGEMLLLAAADLPGLQERIVASNRKLFEIDINDLKDDEAMP